MARYGVSRATVRQALSGLVAEGLLEIRRGRGTFVHGAALEHRLGGFYTFSREIERHGMRPGTRRAQHRRGARVATQVAEGLGLAPGTPVVALSRVRLADDQPIVSETSYLPAARFTGLETGRLLRGQPVRHADGRLRRATRSRARDLRAGPARRR